MAAKRTGLIVRDFADPYIELLRLLREGAEIEHGLMLQYLYSAFSIKEPYQLLVGSGAPVSTNLLGVAIQEMQHLGVVNRLLVKLGSQPHLDRQDFPYEPDIYPFPFALESASGFAMAKYAYAEGPHEMFAADGQLSPEDAQFRDNVVRHIGSLNRPNHVGSLYRNVLELLEEASSQQGFPLTSDETAQWRSDLLEVMEEGEHDHFEFFRQVYEGQHPAFANAGVDNVWDLPPDHPAFPAHQLPANPTAFIGHPNEIASRDAQAIAWLGNLHYWVSLCCLDFAYRYDDQNAMSVSVSQMMTGLWPLSIELPKHGTGIPFDTLSMGYAPGAGKDQSRAIILAMVREADAFARTIEHLLPARYSIEGGKLAAGLMSA